MNDAEGRNAELVRRAAGLFVATIDIKKAPAVETVTYWIGRLGLAWEGETS
jgi:hypothetical protein